MAKRGRPKHPHLLTPREQEVLALIRDGLTNPQIAERLGIGVEGVKYHVSEILSKVGVSSREEAARWREGTRPWWLAAIGLWRPPLRAASIALAGSVVVAAVAGLVLLAVLLVRGGGSSDEQLVVPIDQMFTDPRPRAADETRSLIEPTPAFESWDGESTVLYDTQEMTSLNLGAGTFGRFSADGRWMAWTAGPPYGDLSERAAWVINLGTKERRQLGAGNFLRFLNGGQALIQSAMETFEVIDLETGERTPVTELPPEGTPEPAQAVGEAYDLARIVDDNATPYARNTYRVTDRATGALLFDFTALTAMPAGEGELVVAVPPDDELSNIFIVDIASQTATFVASAKLHYEKGAASPLTANDDYVLWTEDLCSPTPGNTRLFERSSKHLIEIRDSLYAWLRSDGLIAVGAFGPQRLIAPGTLTYVFSVPPRSETPASESSGPDVSWSPDYRYVSQGFAGGHGGYCM